MITNNYRFAEHVVQISTTHEYFHKLAVEYVTTDSPELVITITGDDLVEEAQLSESSQKAEGLNVVKYPDHSLEVTAVHRKLADAFLQYDILLMHGSVISVDGVAYMFTARSGTGKSTHTRLWREHFGDKAVMVNDDKPFISFTADGKALAYGTPWNGKHRLGKNMSCPLKAICWLERSATNQIKQLSSAEMLDTLLVQTYQPFDPMLKLKTLSLLNELCKKVEFYRLGCNMDPEAALVAYEGMRPK
ncbi:MAG: hypothetical protein MJZ23_01330 [Paludibacteraceae bacterium]|nr:hypothetical protein [Paludibacteraceae bacterium]